MLRSLLDAAAGVDPDRIVLTLNGRPITMNDVQRRADALARKLVDHGADACVLLAVNGPVLPLTLMACATAGIPVAPLNYRLPDNDIAALLRQFTKPLTVVDSDQLGRIPADLTTDEWVRLSESPAEPLDLFPDPESTAVVLFTSGTTSAPKPVPLTQSNLGTYALNTIDLCSADAEECSLVSVPPYHVAGVGSAISNLLTGRRAAYLPRFTPRGWLDVVTEQAVTSAMVVPTMLARIVEELGGNVFTGNLKQLSYGGAPTAPSVLHKALELFPGTGFTNAYGLTETSSTLALLTPDDHRAAISSNDADIQARIGSVGRPVPGVEAQIRHDDGKVLDSGEIGVLWVRGQQISGRYLGRASALDEHGWFCTRDGAHMDADGYLFIVGRVDDTIIRGGENVAPAEIEKVLSDHPTVRDVGVVGLPDAEWGQRIAAGVVPVGDDFDIDTFLTWARPLLRSSRTPDVVIVLDELPYGPTGKLLRRQLENRFLEPTPASSDRSSQ
ncbi:MULTISPECIES: class I adenylate-forming enzyme family protein [Rhodococcus]|uniref:class I adenylate-forming enzyme family protein n=1 Tax=Rhodococcus TaxID=1827 RepID=UPI001F1D4B89|nr:class I adenylate-forming enzyme family protein [Rhodococcus globerulus]